MSRNSKKYDIDQIPLHINSVDMQGDFKFGMYKCLVNVHSTFENRMERHCLVIGYVNDEDCLGDPVRKYVVIENAVSRAVGTSSVKVNYVSKNTLEKNFKLSNRPGDGILKYPTKGDKVFCVARERYQGAKGGKEYKVNSMFDDRVDIHGNAYTYEPHYFVVVTSSVGRSLWGEKKEESEPGIMNWESKPKVKGISNCFVMGVDAATSPDAVTMSRVSGVGNIFASLDGSERGKTTPDMIDAMAYAIAGVFDKSVDFNELLEDNIQKREILKPSVIVRKSIEVEEINKRERYKPRAVNR